MADEPTTTGTPDPASGTPALLADGAAAAQAGGAVAGETPEQMKQRIAELESLHKQDLARLSVGEEATRRAEAAEAENERLRRAGAPPMPPAGQFTAEQLDAIYDRQVERMSAADPSLSQEEINATIAFGLRRQKQMTWSVAKNAADEAQFASIPAERRDAVRRLYASGDYRGPAAADLAYRGQQAEVGQAAQRAEADRLRREAENRARSPVVTAPTMIPAVDLSKPREYTRDEWLEVCRKADTGDEFSRRVLWDYDHPARAKQKVTVKS